MVLPAKDSFPSWSRSNGCTGEPTQTLAKGKAVCRSYTACMKSVEVAQCTIQGMGHCLPGMKKESDGNCLTKVVFGLLPVALGMPNDDISGIDTTLDFLSRWKLD